MLMIYPRHPILFENDLDQGQKYLDHFLRCDDDHALSLYLANLAFSIQLLDISHVDQYIMNLKTSSVRRGQGTVMQTEDLNFDKFKVKVDIQLKLSTVRDRSVSQNRHARILTFGDGTIENVSMILSGYSSRILLIMSVPIPAPVPPPRECVSWNPCRQSQLSASFRQTSRTESTSSAPSV